MVDREERTVNPYGLTTLSHGPLSQAVREFVPVIAEGIQPYPSNPTLAAFLTHFSPGLSPCLRDEERKRFGLVGRSV